jgi:hypothetical protein
VVDEGVVAMVVVDDSGKQRGRGKEKREEGGENATDR